MSFFNFSSKPKVKFNWSKVFSMEELETTFSTTGSKPKLFFKHSTRCSISSMALIGFERNWNKELDCDLYFIDLIANKDVSSKLTVLSGVTHQSPQAIVVLFGKVVYTASHSGINANEIEAIIKTK